MSENPIKPARIIVVSGGTGHTADQVLAAALAQFAQPQIEIIREVHIERPEDAERIGQRAADIGASVCHTLVDPAVREVLTQSLVRLSVPVVDPLGPLISMLADQLATAPQGRAGLLYELCREQVDRREAVDFTLAHDDGQRMHDLDRADVVLVGVSRVSKSVTCFYLAARGIFAANVPLTTFDEVPDELTRLDPQRVIGLTMNASRLSAVRQARLDRLTQRPVGGYAESFEVIGELRAAARLMQRHGWRTLDVSYKATEEIASEIIGMIAPHNRVALRKSRSDPHRPFETRP